MGRIKKLKGTDLIGGVNNEDVYPITSTKAVFDEENTSLYTLLNTLASSVETVKETTDNNTTSILQEVSRAKTVEKQLEDSIKKIEPYIKVVWNYDSNINTYIDSGIYNIKGVHLRKEDNLPLESIDAEATFNANLIVLDSTINNLGGTDNGACITQILSISDRVGSEGNVYIRTGRGYIKTVNAITWDSWSVMQTTTNVGLIKDEQHHDGSGWIDGKGMNSLGKTGFYRGIYFDEAEAFFLIVIDNKQAATSGLTRLNWAAQFKYGLPIGGGEISLKVRRGAPKLDDLDVPIEGEFDWGEWKDFRGDSTPTITWQGQNLNDYTTAGVYNIKGKRVNGDNIPISNEGVISARLTVLTSDDNGGNKVVTQVLTLNNNSGGEGNVYVRSSQEGHWKPWGKLQTNIEIGQVNTLDNLVDNGIYSGVLTDGSPTAVGSFYDTFVLIVLNNYSVAGPLGVSQSISQLKYSLKLDATIEVAKRKRDEFGNWTEWESIENNNNIVETVTTYRCNATTSSDAGKSLFDMLPKVGETSIIIGNNYKYPILSVPNVGTAYCKIVRDSFNVFKYSFYDSDRNYYFELEDTTNNKNGDELLSGVNVVRGVLGTALTLNFGTALHYDFKMASGTINFYSGNSYKSYSECNIRSVGLNSQRAIIEGFDGTEVTFKQIST